MGLAQKPELLERFEDGKIATGESFSRLIENSVSDIQDMKLVDETSTVVNDLNFMTRCFRVGRIHYFRGYLKNTGSANLILSPGEYKIGDLADFPQVARLGYSDEMAQPVKQAQTNLGTGAKSFTFTNNLCVQIRPDGIFLKVESSYTMTKSSSYEITLSWDCIRVIYEDTDER